MAEPVLEGASLPEGFEVDETSAYFGITDSSDIVHQLMSLDKFESIVAFFGMVSEVVLKPGEFDFEEASKVLNCEGGEIYFLVSGHLGLMSFTDPVLHYLGLPNSQGEESPNEEPDITKPHYDSLKRLSDPMNMLKLLAIAQSTGGPDEVMKYYLTLSEMLQDVTANSSLLIDIADEFDSALDVIGHPIPISHLMNSTVDLTNIPTVAERTITKAPATPKQDTGKTDNLGATETELPNTERQRDIAKNPVPSLNLEPQVSVPLPGKTVKVEQSPKPIEQISVDSKLTDRKAAKVTDNAFEGAFGMMAQPEPEQIATSTVDVARQPESGSGAELVDDPEAMIEPESPEEVEETFVSAAEMFVQADKDDDGTLSPEELADAAGITVEESQELHKSADKDDDGKMSLSEFVASPAAEKVASNLPKPVAPVRKPVKKPEATNRQVLPPQSNTPRPIPPQNIAPQPVVRNQPISQAPPQVPQQQMWNQPIQPTIRSGINCRGCGIGIDPYWRFCPVCGTQNLN